MKSHRSDSFDKFINIVDKNLLRTYLVGRGVTIDDTQEIDDDYVHGIIEGITDENKRLDIVEELLCLNDIADKKIDHLDEVVDEFNIQCGEDDPPETVAMRVFLHDDDRAFDIAYDHYLCDMHSEKLNHYPLSGEFDVSKIELFKTEIQEFFKETRKTDNCYIRAREHQGKHHILIARCDSVKTHRILEGKRFRVRVYRPAKEDMIVYDIEKSVVSISSGVRSGDEKEMYIRALGRHVLGVPNVGREVFSAQSALIKLEPALDQKFYAKTDEVKDIKLVSATIIHKATQTTTWFVKSDDVLQSIKELPFPMADCELVGLRLDFYFNDQKRPVAVNLTRRGSSVIKLRKEKKIVEDFLRAKGIVFF